MSEEKLREELWNKVNTKFEEYKKEIAKNPKEMEVIYDKIDRRHENRLLAISKAKQT